MAAIISITTGAGLLHESAVAPRLNQVWVCISIIRSHH